MTNKQKLINNLYESACKLSNNFEKKKEIVMRWSKCTNTEFYEALKIYKNEMLKECKDGKGEPLFFY